MKIDCSNKALCVLGCKQALRVKKGKRKKKGKRRDNCGTTFDER